MALAWREELRTWDDADLRVVRAQRAVREANADLEGAEAAVWRRGACEPTPDAVHRGRLIGYMLSHGDELDAKLWAAFREGVAHR